MYVAVDIALNVSGIAVFSDEGEFISSEVIEVTASWDYYKKLAHLYSKYIEVFENLLTEGVSHVTLILEGRLKAGGFINSVASIEGARVTCFLAYSAVCETHGLKPTLHVYDPNVVKLSIAGKRSAKKDEMLTKALSSYSWLSKIEYQEDIFDAIYLMLHHKKVGNSEQQHNRRNKKKPKI